MGRYAEAADEARRALAVAREIGYPGGEVLALATSAVAASGAGDQDGAVRLARQAAQITAGVPGSIARWCSYVLTGVLIEAGDLAAAEPVCAAALARARDAGDLGTRRACWHMDGDLGPGGGPHPGRRGAPAGSDSSSTCGPATG